MFCAIFIRLLGNLTSSAEKNPLIHFKIELKEMANSRIKVLGGDVKKFLQKRNEFFNLFPLQKMAETKALWNVSIFDIMKLICEQFEWLFVVSSKYEPTLEHISQYPVNTKKFVENMKALISGNIIKDYEHILVYHAPTILKVIVIH